MQRDLHRLIHFTLSLALATTPVATRAAEETAQPADAPTFTTPQMPEAPKPVQPEDRKNGSGSAQAAAIAGAAMAGAMCAMLMQQAMKEKDPQRRMMLMMMANQQCMQAAQSAQAGKDNEKSKDKLSQNDPKPPTLPATQPLKAPAAPKESDLLKDLEKNPLAADDSLSPPIDSGDTSQLPGITLPGAQAANEGGVSPFTVESVSTLNPIANPNLTVQEDAKNATGGGGSQPTTLSVSTARSLGNDDLKAVIQSRTESERTGRGINRDDESSSNNSGGAGNSSSSGDSKDFDAMMASLMGGGAAAESEGARQDVLALGQGETRENIFQHASYRYQRAAKKDQRLARNPKRQVASQIVQ